MIFKRIKDNGILAKLLEKGIKILIQRECEKIGNIKINIIASSIQIIKGIIKKIHIIAKDVNYKNLLFNEVELEANEVKINLKKNNKELNLENNSIIKIKIALSGDSLNTILLSNNWNWIGEIISKEILNQAKLEDIKIKNNQLLIKTSKNNYTIDERQKVDIKTENGKIYLENKLVKKSIEIPIEDKVYIKNIDFKNNLINIIAESYLSF